MIDEQKTVYLQAPQILKSWLGYLDLMKPFLFLQLWAKMCHVDCFYAKIVRSPQGPAAYRPPDMPFQA